MNNLWIGLLGQTATLATIITAIVAYKIYQKAKADELEDAARILILEIRESEKAIKKLLEFKNTHPDPKSTGYPNDLIKIIPSRAWAKYSHLFIKKVNNDEYDQLSDYYSKCEVLEKYIEKNHNFFWVSSEERAKQNEIIATQLALNNPDMKKEFYNIEHEKITNLCFVGIAPFTPAGIRTQIDKNLNSISLITPTPTWNKLKLIAKYDDLLG